MIFINNTISSLLFWYHFILNMMPWLYNQKQKSTIDWCEDNYKNNLFIAEYYNSISMIPAILILSIKLYQVKKKNIYPLLAYFLVIWLSIGSFMFHATLDRFWQAQDELPMLYLGIWSFFCAMKLYGKEVRNSLTLFTCICCFITRYYTLSTSYLEFIIPYILITTSSLLSILYHIINYCQDYKTKSIGLSGILTIIIGFVFWLLDLFHCSSWKLHALWHICIGITKYSLIEYITLTLQSRQDYLLKNV